MTGLCISSPADVLTDSVWIKGHLTSDQFFWSSTANLTEPDSDGMLKTFKKPQGQLSTFTYDTIGNLIKDAHSGGYTVTIEKELDGRETYIYSTSQMGRVTAQVMESFKIPSADGTRDISVYSRKEQRPDMKLKVSWISNDEELVVTDGIEYDTRFKNDERFGDLARTVSYSSASGSTTFRSSSSEESFELRDSKNPFSIKSYMSIQTDQNGANTITNYDGENKSFYSQTPRGSFVFTKVDAFERIISAQLGNDLPTDITYTDDKLTRKSQGNRFVEYVYDSNTKKLVSTKNVLGQSTQYVYDNAGRLTAAEYPDGKKILFHYDDNNKLIAITPADKPKHSFNFNSLELLTGYTPPSLANEVSTPSIYTYNEDKQPLSVVKPDGKKISYNYDPEKGTLTSIVVPEGTYKYEFNPTYGQYDRVINPSSFETQKHRLEGGFLELDILNKAGKTLGYYKAFPDSQGRVRMDGVIGLENSAPLVLNYSYGIDGKLEKVETEEISYDKSTGRISGTNTSIGASLVRDYYQYNSYGELASYVASYNDTFLYSLDLTYDDLGRVVSKIEAIGEMFNQKFDYAYDTRGRLIEVKKNDKVINKYNYDANDNRIAGVVSGQTTTATYDSQDRLLAYNSDSFQYNQNGELISRKNSVTNQVIPYSFDSFGKVTSIKVGSNLYDYQMDGVGRRAQNFMNGKLRSSYIYMDQNRLAGVVGTDGIALQRFGYGAKSHVPDLMIMNGETYRIITDHLGSVRLVVKASDGSIVQEMLHDEFGKILKNTAPGFQPFGFAGGLFDHTTNLVQFGARWYDPVIGRWISKDPIGFNGGDTNLYGYVANDPINFFDPSGYAKCKYSISTGDLICKSNDGTQTFNLTAFSGNKDNRNDPTKTGLPGGPLPMGQYNITKVDGDLSSMDWFLDPGLISRIGYRLGANRGGFNMHLRPGGSEGCITSKGNSKDTLQNLNNLLNGEAGNNTIDVGN